MQVSGMCVVYLFTSRRCHESCSGVSSRKWREKREKAEHASKLNAKPLWCQVWQEAGLVANKTTTMLT